MTKVTKLNEPSLENKTKLIEFKYAINVEGLKITAVTTCCAPSQWNNIKLLGKCEGLDVMLCWDDDNESKYIYYGWFNDGIAE